ncbi:hypothetical protein PT974_03937 [Cladobotryum mycophilum]|uniref:Uncharacterized protein n=1 Tax=Cladobotryum mycophilum TaxID=491253 RepID=A0ABR0STP2_9HYPO
MTQPTPIDANGVSKPHVEEENAHLAVPAKRKRDNGDQADVADQDIKMDEGRRQRKISTNPSKTTLSLDDDDVPILKRLIPTSESYDEPQAKRQKSVEPPSMKSISDKVADNAYATIDDVAADVVSAVRISLSELNSKPTDAITKAATAKQAARLTEFQDKAMELVRREKAYPKTRPDPTSGEVDAHTASERSEMVLSLVGYAPQERRLFSSLPLSQDVDLSEVSLPPGVSITRVVPANPQERSQTLGELFAPPRALPPLQPPKQPKTQAKGNRLDFYHPHPADSSKYRSSNYFNTKLSTGYYLDYSNATPSWQTKTKQRERAQSLAGKKPSTTELEVSEVESLFRGAFSSFAPCKDDSAAVIPASVAGRMWWQRVGQRNFQRMIEVEYYGDIEDTSPLRENQSVELDEAALQEAFENYDDTVIDPSLEDVMGTRREDQEKEADEILDEVSDLIETLASYQRIRNLSLPNSQNRQSSDPVAGDMLANSGPQPTEEEQATYHVLKAQLALIIKTLPPYAVAKLNGDQLDELLISTKIMVQTDQYKGTMEEDEAGVQARLKAQQQAAAAQAAQASARPPQRTPSVTSVPYPQQYQPPNHYGTPSRTPAPHQPQYYRNTATPSYQPPRHPGPPAPHPPRPQPNQYTRSNGYPTQYATQLAKAQTPYGHQSMPQYAAQQRPPYGQVPPPGTPSSRYPFQQGYPHQQGTPTHANYGSYTNGGSALPARTMSPQVGQRQTYSPTPNMQQTQRYGAPNPNMNPQANRFPAGTGQVGAHSQSPGLVGYHTVIPESQQQRILEQAKARMAAQERSAAMLSQSGLAGLSYGTPLDPNRVAAVRGMASQTKPQTPTGQKPGVNGNSGPAHVPYKVTPVPVPVIPGSQRKPTT